MLFIVLLSALSLVTGQEVCQPKYNVTCPGSTIDPGLTGNMAFLVMQDLGGFETAKKITSFISTNWDPTASYFTPTTPTQFHISIYYFPCVSVNYTAPIHEALKSFTWDSFSVKLTNTCCGLEDAGWSLLMCVDPDSEAKIRDFSKRIRVHLNDRLGPDTIPDKEYSQPWHHVTIGYALPNMSIPILSSAPQPNVSLQLDAFYFGTELYVSRDFTKSGGFSNLVFLALVPVVFLILVCLVPAIRLSIFTAFGCVHVLVAIEDKLCDSCQRAPRAAKSQV